MKKLFLRSPIIIILLGLSLLFGGGLGYAFFFGGSSVNLNKGLVGYWDFGAGSTTAATPDRTPNNNDGTVTGATIAGISDRKGQSGKAYSFDGTDYISVTDADILDAGTGDFSYSLWFNGTVTGTPVLLRKFSAANGGYQLILNGSKIYMRFSEGTDEGGSGDIETQGATTLSASTWYFVAVTHDRDGNIVGYLNGVSDVSTSIATAESSANNAANLFIGAQDTTPNSPFIGTIDDVRLYNRLLTQAEVTASYESYDPGIVVSDLQKGLVGYWNFGAGSTTTLTPDRTPNNNDGNVTGATISGITDRKGQSDKAYTFNGTSDNISITHNAVFNVSSITVSAWIKPTTLTGSSTIIGKKYSGGGARTWELMYDLNGKLYWFISTDSQTILLDEAASATQAIVTGNWYYVVGTYSGGVSFLYINGVQVGTDTGGGTLDTNTLDILIAKNYSTPDYSDGVIDDVRIYNRALSATEVLALYESYR